MEVKNGKMRKAAGHRNTKGILLTLLVVVLFILMLGEVITYVVLNINDSTLAQSAASAQSYGSLSALISKDASSSLQSSLESAVQAMVSIEGNPNLQMNIPVNNTDYFLESLMGSGSVYGKDYSGFMGPLLVSNLSTALNDELNPFGANVIVDRGTITVYQGTPSTINATYTTSITVNESSGTYTIPIHTTVGMPLNDTFDLLSVEEHIPSRILLQHNYPKASAVGGAYAIGGSTSPMMFTFGTAFLAKGVSSCTSIPTQFQNANFILIVKDGSSVPQGACSMGGLVANILPSTTENVPFLQYALTSNVFNSIINGTQVLLDGPGLALLNVSSIQTAIQNNYYYASPDTPSWDNEAQQNSAPGTNGGIFSFGQESRGVAQFNGISTVAESSGLAFMNSALQNFTFSIWINPSKPNGVIVDEVNVIDGWHDSWLELYNSGLYMAVWGRTSCTFIANVPVNTWTNIVMTGNVAPSTQDIMYSGYVNGVHMASGGGFKRLVPGSSYAMSYILGNPDGTNCGSGAAFQGQMANFQLYNDTLNKYNVSALYREGISGLPIMPQNDVLWYQLNANASDFSNTMDNGVPTAVSFGPVGGYASGLTIRKPSIVGMTVASFNALSPYASYIMIPTNSLPYYNSPRTLTAWVYEKALGGDTNWGSIFSYGTGGGVGADFGLGNVNGRLDQWGSSDDYATTYNLPVDNWVFVAADYNSTKQSANAWIDMINSTKTLGSAYATIPSNAYIGLDHYNGGMFNGLITNIQIYNTSLNYSQLTQLYSEGINGGPLPYNLSGWWPLHGNAYDYSGRGQNGVLSNVNFVQVPSDSTSDVVDGVLNCGNINQCSNQSVPHLYLSNLPLENAGRGYMNETTSLGLMSAAVPDVAMMDGTSGFIYAQDPAKLQLSTLTLSGWVYYRGPSIGSWNWMAAKQNAWGVGACGSTLVLCFYNWGTHTAYQSSTALQENKWYFITAVIGGGTEQVYLDGSSIFSDPLAVSSQGNDFEIGYGNCCSQYLNGSVADLSIYGTDLTQPQIMDLYLNNTVPGEVPVSYWPLSTGYNSTINVTEDVSGGVNGYLYSSSTLCTANMVYSGQCGVSFTPP
ncbi:MAG: LamG domain-containing protein [Candidatus Marsarchaeota archaeon]|nr:LamG domain-containing protein [Candidatus Marsarchaeota archaeon]